MKISTTYIRQSKLVSCLVAVLLAGPAHGLTIVPTYIDGLGNWDSVGTNNADGRITFNAAISVWESLILSDLTVNVTVTFDNFNLNTELDAAAVGIWAGDANVSCSGSACDVPIDLRPNSPFITHTIYFDTTDLGSLFFDQTVADMSDLPGSDIDAFSVALHEIGHMLGFSCCLFSDDVFQVNGPSTNPWLELIDSFGVFDPGGLSVQMAGDFSHLFPTGAPGGGLMEPAIFPGERRLPSMLELEMLARAYNYQLVPVPAPLALLLSAVAGSLFFRRRSKA